MIQAKEVYLKFGIGKILLDLKDYLKIKMKSNIKIIENNLKINFNNKKLLIQV